MSKCGAKNRNGGICKGQAMPNGRCWLHGGKTPIGPAAGNYKHGRRSKYLPERLAATYIEGQSDARMLELRDEISVVDARINDVLSRVDSGESGAIWQTLQQTMDAFSDAERAQDVPGMRVQLAELRKLIAQGKGDWAAWETVMRLIDQRRRLVESERKRLVEMHQMISAERALALIGAIVGVVKTHVTDRATLTAITYGIQGLLTRNSAKDVNEVGG